MKTFLMLFLAAFFPLASQQTAQNTPPVFRVSTSLATVRFHVVKKSSYVDTVTANDIVLLEDGKPRQIALFEGGKTKMRTSPVEVLILFDCSWGMKYYGRYDGLAISSSLFDDLPNVSLGVYGFQSELKRFCSPTRTKSEFLNAIVRLADHLNGKPAAYEEIPLELSKEALSHGYRDKSGKIQGNWLFEPIAAAIKEPFADQQTAARMILVFSGGTNARNYSRPAREIAALARDHGVPIYPIVLNDNVYVNARNYADQVGAFPKNGADDFYAKYMDNLTRMKNEFASLGEYSGGRSLHAFGLNKESMRQILDSMVQEVRSEYMVAFSPEPSQGAPKKHKVEVKLRSNEIGKMIGGIRMIMY